MGNSATHGPEVFQKLNLLCPCVNSGAKGLPVFLERVYNPSLLAVVPTQDGCQPDFTVSFLTSLLRCPALALSGREEEGCDEPVLIAALHELSSLGISFSEL